MVASQSRVLITGIQGFTGQHLSRTLVEAGYEVFGLIQAGESSSHLLVTELTDPGCVLEALRTAAPDYVVHLAGLSFAAEKDVRRYYDVNAVGTLNLLEAIERECPNLRKLILASSASVYGPQDVTTISEAVCPNPASHYGASKLSMEHIASVWSRKLPVVVTRPFNYTGVGQREDFVIPKIVSHFRRRETRIRLGNIAVSRDFSDVRDVVNAYSLLLKSDVRSGLFNICSGRPTSLTDVLDTLESLTHHHIQIEIDESLVRPDDPKVLIGDPARLEKAVGYKARISMIDTLQWMLGE